MRAAILALAAVIFVSAGSARATEVSFERDTSLPLIYLNVAVKAGSVNDPPGQSGITNFMGEMLLRGTTSRNKEQIDLAIDQLGAQVAVETRAEALIIRGAVLSSQLDPFLGLLQELITQSNFPDQEIRKLKSEVVSEILDEEGSDQTLGMRRFDQFLFQGHPYGNPVLGKAKEIETISRDQVIDQYNRMIADDHLLVVGTGDTTADKIEKWADALAKARPDTSKSKEIKSVDTPKNGDRRRLLIVDKPDRTQTQINLGQVGVRLTDKDFFPLYLGNYAFGGGSFSARLMVEIRVKRGWSYGANSYFRHGLKPREWLVHLFPAAKDTPPALAQTLKMIAQLKESGITEPEYKFAQQSLVSSAGFMYNTPRKRVENTLLERTLDLPDGFMKTYGPELEKVELKDVNSALRKFLQPDKLAIVVVGTAQDLKAPLAKAAAIPENEVQVVPYNQE